MGQHEVCLFLKKYKDHSFTSKQIAEKLNVSHSSVQTSLSKINRMGILEKIQYGNGNCFTYKYKRKR